MARVDRFRILVVCTGNICRSPAAALLLADRLGPSVEVTSAGTYGLVGSPVDAPMARLLDQAGVPSAGFSARRLNLETLGGSDLVLGMSTDHRREIVELAPAVVRRTFTLRELARLLEDVDAPEPPEGTAAERLRAVLPLVMARRSPSPSSDNIDDPLGGPDTAYDRAFSLIEDAITRIDRALAVGAPASRSVDPQKRSW